MKTRLPFLKCIGFAVMFIWQAESQTNTIPITNATSILTTNVIMVQPWYREVNGQIYDPMKSKLWTRFDLWNEVKVAEVLPDDCYAFQFFKNENISDTYRIVRGKKFMLRNIQCTPRFRKGDAVSFRGDQRWAMYLGTTNWNGEAIPLWDYGLPLKTNEITIVITNYPAHIKN